MDEGPFSLPDRLYIQPLTLVPSPQAVAGDAIHTSLIARANEDWGRSD